MVSRTNGRRPTIYDIAVAAGASATTVSFVLNDSWRAHRIKSETAARVLESADQLGYAVNLKARGLRLSRSGLAGMIVPHYRNRFFAGLAEAFEAEARARGLCPVVVSTQRDAGIEATVIKTLLAQQVEFLFIVGVHDPDPLNEMCRAARIRCVNIDLPGPLAPSVVSDNRGGAKALTAVILRKLGDRGAPLEDLFFFGGLVSDDATSKRVQGFREALAQHGVPIDEAMIDCCGYPPTTAAQSLSRRYETLGRLPSGLFVNGVTALEGALQFTTSLPPTALDSIVVGSFDWDPFAAHLFFDVTMVRQNVEEMIAQGFQLLNVASVEPFPLIVVPTSFGRAGGSEGPTDDCASVPSLRKTPR